MIRLNVNACGFVILAGLLAAGCTTVGSQIVPTTLHRIIALAPGDLEQGGVAFITPSTVTGQEQDRQTLALIFAEAMREQRPGMHVVPLSEALGLINRAGLAEEYRKLIDDYRETGILRREGLAKAGRATGARYLVQLKLAGFTQTVQERFSLLGFRLFQTLHANIRLYLQVWDSEAGVIVWEGSEEMSYAYDSSVERPVTFRAIVAAAAQELIASMP